MLVDVIKVKVISKSKLYIKFEDDNEGIIDLKNIIDFSGIYKPLKNEKYFKLVAVNQDTGTICWPNGADICPDVLYSIICKKTIPTFSTV